MPNRRPLVRVLAIPQGQTKDAEGRDLGDNWLLCDFGEEDDFAANITTHYYVTTDRIHASDPVHDQLGAKKLAEGFAQWLNREWREK